MPTWDKRVHSTMIKTQICINWFDWITEILNSSTIITRISWLSLKAGPQSCFLEKWVVVTFRSHSEQKGGCWNSPAHAHDAFAPPLAAAVNVGMAVPNSSPLNQPTTSWEWGSHPFGGALECGNRISSANFYIVFHSNCGSILLSFWNGRRMGRCRQPMQIMPLRQASKNWS